MMRYLLGVLSLVFEVWLLFLVLVDNKVELQY